LHQGSAKSEKNGCYIEDMVFAISEILKRSMQENPCGSEQRLGAALAHLRSAAGLLSEHRQYCVNCNPDITSNG
jgi:hypothetical protein